jgi:hypothetical protein
MKILFWDIETTDLCADWGRLLCIGYKWAHQKRAKLIKCTDFPAEDEKGIVSDRAVCEAFYKVAVEADVWVYHYGKKFDRAFLNARLMSHGLPSLPQPPEIGAVDTWKVAYDNLKMKARRLDSLGEFFGCKTSKTRLSPLIWRQAGGGHLPSLKYIFDHCRKDVYLLEEVFNRLRPFVKMPNFNLVSGKTDACPVCGEQALQSRGWRYARVRKYRRYQCQNCGKWCSGKPMVVEGVEIR